VDPVHADGEKDQDAQADQLVEVEENGAIRLPGMLQPEAGSEDQEEEQTCICEAYFKNVHDSSLVEKY
jgi:hypothetical protein